MNIIYCFLRPTREYFTLGYITSAGEGLQNLGLWLCLTLRAFKQGWSLYRATLFVTESHFFRSRSFEFIDRPHSIAMKGDMLRT
jgi:hypothetical protein